MLWACPTGCNKSSLRHQARPAANLIPPDETEPVAANLFALARLD
jgi:hypothetical protein